MLGAKLIEEDFEPSFGWETAGKRNPENDETSKVIQHKYKARRVDEQTDPYALELS